MSNSLACLILLSKNVAEQYPIPSDGGRASEGDTERVIGKWIKDRKVDREKVVIATKITGGRNVTPRNIQADCKLLAATDTRVSNLLTSLEFAFG